MRKFSYIFIYVMMGVLLFSSCKKDLNTMPTDQISEDAALSTIPNARTALNGIYRALYMQYSGQAEDGHTAMMINMDFMGEDIVHTATGTSYFRGAHRWIDHLSEASALTLFAYRFHYKIIANATQIISRIDEIPGDSGEKNTIKAEALGLRAWGHFQLVQLFGKRYDASLVPNSQPGVPLVTMPTTDPLPRSSVEEVYKQINKDLDSALANLDVNAGGQAKTHLNLASVRGLKARVALTMQNWTEAAQYASLARAGYSLMSREDYLKGFSSMGNSEWMWAANQLPDQLPNFGSFYSYMSANFNSSHTRTNPKLINSKLYALIPTTDIRKKLWWDGTTADAVNFPGVINASTGQPEPTQRKAKYMHRKYLVPNPTVSAGDVPFMRVAEMYLIAAEAYARAGMNAEAQDALFALIKARDPNYVKTTKTSQALIDEILVHRRVELWGEGFRFLDLKRLNSPLDRTGTGATTTLAGILSVAAGDARWQFKIPRREIETNPDIEQNP